MERRLARPRHRRAGEVVDAVLERPAPERRLDGLDARPRRRSRAGRTRSARGRARRARVRRRRPPPPPRGSRRASPAARGRPTSRAGRGRARRAPPRRAGVQARTTEATSGRSMRASTTPMRSRGSARVAQRGIQQLAVEQVADHEVVGARAERRRRRLARCRQVAARGRVHEVVGDARRDVLAHDRRRDARSSAGSRPRAPRAARASRSIRSTRSARAAMRCERDVVAVAGAHDGDARARQRDGARAPPRARRARAASARGARPWRVRCAACWRAWPGRRGRGASACAGG